MAGPLVAIMSGAGISTDSGIPDYRGPNGLWRRDPEPNAAHRAIAGLERSGVAVRVITQNVDGLARLEAGEPDPPCRDCGGILKTDTVMFGEELNSEVLGQAARIARACTVIREPIGTSLPRLLTRLQRELTEGKAST